MTPTRRTLLALSLAAALPLPAAAAACVRDADANPAQVIARMDNDVFGGAHQDQGYTAGFNLAFVSPTLDGFRDDPCLPRLARWFNGLLGPLSATRGEARNMVFALNQAIYTPTDRFRSDLIVDDRPYAAVLSMQFGFNTRRGDVLDSTHLRLGILGPSAQGESIQDGFHGLFGRQRFRGWDHQLRDEPVLQLLHERTWRWQGPQSASGWGWDYQLHAGGAAGNLASYVNGGGGLRFGRHLPDDFGSSPLRPGGDNSAPRLRATERDWAWHLYASLDNRWVFNDVTLDGNTWKDSHSVDRRDFVADLNLGIVVTYGEWKFAATHTRRTREFHGQREAPVFGTFTLAREF